MKRAAVAALAVLLVVLPLLALLRPSTILETSEAAVTASTAVAVTEAEETATATDTVAPPETATNTPAPPATEEATETPAAIDTSTVEETATELSPSTATPTETAIPTLTPTPVPGLSLSATSGNVNARIAVQVRKFRPNSRVAVYFGTTRVLTLYTDAVGTARDYFRIPATPAGSYTIRADGALSKTAAASFRVRAYLKLNSGTVTAGQSITASVSGFGQSTTVRVRLYEVNSTTVYVTLGSIATDATGSGRATFVVPRTTKAGSHTVLAVQSTNRDDTTLSVKVPTSTPTKTATPRPTRTPTPRPTSTPQPRISVSVYVNCYSKPELTRITNSSNVNVRLTSVGSIYQPRSNEPFGVSKTLQPGQSITYQTGYTASSNVLTNQYIYADTAGTAEGARVTSDRGTFTDRC